MNTRNMNTHNAIGRLSLCGLLIIGFAARLPATTVTADSAPFWTAPVLSATGTGSASWYWSNPKATDTITWTSGVNHADGVAYANAPVTESKFPSPPVVSNKFYPFTGFSYINGVGPALIGPPPACNTAVSSCAITSGSGGSTYTQRGSGVTPAHANADWTLTATGVLGGPALIPTYDSTASGKDPWTISSSDLIGLTDGYSLFFTAGLDNATFSANGSVGWEVDYSDAATTHLLQVLLDPTGVHVSSSSGAAALGLSIYLVPPGGADPNIFSGAPLTLSEIQNLLQLDLSGNNLNNPIEFGFLLNNLPIPTVDMGNGVLAQIDITSTANDRAQAPEPETLSLFAGGGLLIAAGAWRKRKRAP